jgi:hypothetical protein
LERYEKALAGRWPKAGISAPLNYRGQTLGVLTLQNLQTAHVFSDVDLETLDALAQSAAISIVNARLFEAEHSNRLRLEALHAEGTRQRDMLERRLKIQDELAEVMRAGPTLPSLAARLASLCGGDVLVLDAIYRVRAAEPSLGVSDLKEFQTDDADVLRDAIRRASRTRALEHLQLSASRTVLVSPVFTGPEVLGYVLLDIRDRVPDQIDKVAVDSTAMISVAPFLAERALGEVDIRRRDDLLHQLLGGSVPLAAAGLTALPLPLVLAVGALHPVGQSKTASDARSFRTLLNLARDTSEVDKGPTMVTVRQDHLVLIWVASPTPDSGITRYLGHLVSRFRRMEPGWDSTFAVADPVFQLTGVAGAFQEARLAIQLRRVLTLDENVFMIRGLGAYRFILRSATGDEANELCEQVLGSTIAHDKAHGGKLLATFRAYLANNSSLKSTAVTLGVHPHTIQYRLDKLQELSGLTLARPEERLSLELASRLLELSEL